jgi:hypothetical protein
MLSNLDWLLRCKAGAELLATLQYLDAKPGRFPEMEALGSPHSALGNLCRRCWIFPRITEPTPRLWCAACQPIMDRVQELGDLSKRSVVVWAGVNQLPRHLQKRQRFYEYLAGGVYVHDERHFLLIMPKNQLKDWIQETILYEPDLRGLIQIFPTLGSNQPHRMGDLLARVMYYESGYPMDQLWVQFYTAPYQVLVPHVREREGLLTFESADFLGLLESASVFRTLLKPDAQQALYELLTLKDIKEEQFYWGRLLGELSPEAKDLLSAWRIRQWSQPRLKMLYDLMEYVAFYSTY